jgi:single-stranded-DNA-specific exonuclease
MAPVFATDNVYDNGEGRLVGNEKEHIKLSLVQKNNSKVFNGIAFQLGEHYRFVHSGKSFSVCYSISENVFRGVSSLQLRVKDIKYNQD